MRSNPTLLAALLLRLSDLSSSAPLVLTEGARHSDIWVTKENTLNATCWPQDLKGLHGQGILVKVNDTSAPTGDSNVIQEVVATTTAAPHNSTSTLAMSTTDPTSNSTSSNSTSIPPAIPVITTGAPSDPNVTNHSSLNSTSSNTTALPNTYPIITTQGIAASNLTNSTTSESKISILAADAPAGGPTDGVLSLQFVNKWTSSNLKVYITGLDSNGALIMLGQNGQFVYPTTSSSTPQPVDANVAIPLGKPNSTLPITLPGFISSSRVWVAEGNLQFYVVATPNGPGLVQPAAANPNDPNSQVNYAFAELSWGSSYGLYADISAVDFVGLPLGIELTNAKNVKQSVLGTPANAASALCDSLKAQSKIDGVAWNQLCAYGSTGKLIRVVAPNLLQSSNRNAFGTYYAKYVGDVWSYYSTHDLIIDTQTTPGNVTCRVTGNTLNCAGDNRGYAKPNNFDIFGCNTGPFAIQAEDNEVHLAVVPRLCAAFNRATLLISDGYVQPSLQIPPARYYAPIDRPANTRPLNHYSALVHAMEVGGRGYAFSYDDVTPAAGLDQSGLVYSTTPKLLKIIVGGSG